MLIGATGVAVDIGYWFQQQESLQSATDAAAMSVGIAATKYSVTANNVAQPFAQAAANNATNSQFNLTNVTATPTTITLTDNNTATQWITSANVPRASFFSGVGGRGLGTLVAGRQYASSGVDVIISATPPCLYTTATSGTDIDVTSGTAGIIGASCGIYSESPACSGGNSSIVASPGEIIGSSVETATNGCGNASSSGSYIGTSSSGGSSSGQVTLPTTSTPPTDLESGLAAWPSTLTWPPNSIYTPSSTLTTSPSTTLTSSNTNGYLEGGNSSSFPGGTCPSNSPCDLATGYSYSNNLTLEGPTYNIGTIRSTSATLATTGTTEFNGALGTQNCNGACNINIGGADFWVNGGASLTGIGSFTTSAGETEINGNLTYSNCNGTCTTTVDDSTEFWVNGATSLVGVGAFTTADGVSANYVFGGEFSATNTNTTISLGLGTYYFDNTSNNSLNFQNAESFTTTANSTFYVNGNQSTDSFYAQNGGTYTFGTGTYFFNGPFFAQSATINFTGGTYFFYGGLSLQNNVSVYFGPGIYYFYNGTFPFGSNSGNDTVIANGATFVFEGTANYSFTNSGLYNLVAPNTSNDPNCVAPGSFPEASYSNGTFPYDGTDGNGICGVLFYQAPSDTTADTMNLPSASYSSTTTTSTGTVTDGVTTSATPGTSSRVASMTSTNITTSGSTNTTTTTTYTQGLFLTGVIYQPNAAFSAQNGTLQPILGGTLQIEAKTMSVSNTMVHLSSGASSSSVSSNEFMLVK